MESEITRTNVATVKAHFSEFLGRVAFGGKRYLIERRGKPVAALVPVEDLDAELIGSRAVDETGDPLLAIAGVWHGLITWEEWEPILKEIYDSRDRDLGRPVDLDL